MFRNKINRIISGWKGEEYKIDKNVPFSYLAGLSVNRIVMLINGFMSGIRNGGLFFLAGTARIRGKSFCRFGKLVTIERNSFIDALSREGIVLGNNVSLGMNSRIEGTGNLQHLGKGLRAGNNVGMGADCFYGCAGGIEIGDDTIIGNYVSFHSENHNRHHPDKPIRRQGVSHKGIYIGNNCWIGSKCTILDGVIIPDGCIIAAGSVVTSGNYEANSIYGGVPARFLKYRVGESLKMGK